MQSNKEDNTGLYIFALFGVVVYMAALLIFTIAVMAAVVLTVLSLFAWDEPLSLFGLKIDSEEARTFVCGGLIFAGFAPLGLLLFEFLWHMRINGDYFFHILAGAYVIGAFVSTAMLQEKREREAAQIEIMPPSPWGALPKAADPKPIEKPFYFADWDDGKPS